MKIKKLELLEKFQFFSDSDDETSGWIVSEVEFIDEIGDELEKSATTFAEVDRRSVHFFEALEFFHFMTRFWLESSSGIGHLDIDREDIPLSFELYMEDILVEWETSVLDRIIDELVWDEDETILPWDIDIVFFEKREDEVSDDFGLTVIGLESDSEVEISEIGDVFIRKIEQIFVVEIGYIYLEHEQSIGIRGHYIE